MAARYKQSYAGIGRLMTSGGMALTMRELIEPARVEAIATSPVDEYGPHPGRYKGAWHVTTGVKGKGRKKRAYARLSNDSPEAVYVEFGTEHNDAHHTAARALDAVGR